MKTNEPIPTLALDDLLHMAASAIEDLLEHTDPNTSYYSGVWADVPGKLRAAMLQAGNHAEERRMLHVWTNPDFNAESSRGQSDIFNANGWHARFYEQNKPTKFPYDYNPGNSPAIPDRWIPVSERMPEKGQAVLVYRPKAHEGGDSDVRVAVYGRHNFEHGFGCYWEPSHWMPLPASPQEVQ